MNKYFSGAYSIFVHLDINDKKVNFPNIPQLRDKRIKHLDFCRPGSLQFVPGGYSIINESLNNMNNMFITLREKNTQRDLIVNLPVTELDPEISGARLFINKIIDFENSIIDVSKMTNIDDVWLCFVAYYDFRENWQMINENNRTAILPLEVECAAGTKKYLSDNKQLIGKSVLNIIHSLPTITPSGKTGIVSHSGKYLTLSYNNVEFISRLPIYLLNQSRYNYPLRFQGVKFDPDDSYIETFDNSAAGTAFFNLICNDNKN